MSDVRARVRVLVQRVAEGGEIPIASLRDLGELMLRSELVALSHQLLEGPPEFALRRAMELARSTSAGTRRVLHRPYHS
ncbi:MAG: hypothetical protein KJN97_01595 [Deltaproteobacteria bacterium]|nr:hypothetical protein [Deltaproteobacteria bacterium]